MTPQWLEHGVIHCILNCPGQKQIFMRSEAHCEASRVYESRVKIPNAFKATAKEGDCLASVECVWVCKQPSIKAAITHCV